MRLPVANSQSVDFTVPSKGMAGAVPPGRWRTRHSVVLTQQELMCIFKGLLRLRPLQGPTYVRALTRVIEPLVPKTGRLVPLWYPTQNMPHREGVGFFGPSTIPKRFRRPACVDPASKYFTGKTTSFRFGTPDATFLAFQLHPAAEGNPLP
jgi:hypothetical protein